METDMSTVKRIKPRRRILLVLSLLCLILPTVLTQRQAAVAVVTVTEFSDFQCPYCKRAASVVEKVRAYYGGRVRFVFKQMPLRMHEHAFKAAQASLCASAQASFWEYHDRLFAADDLSVDGLNRIAATVGLNQEDFSQCLSSENSKAEVERDMAEA